MVVSGYIISFVIGVAVGFVFAAVILFRDRLNRMSEIENKE
jgi:tetrahydromethanopterin S-methyltransferase subunit F